MPGQRVTEVPLDGCDWPEPVLPPEGQPRLIEVAAYTRRYTPRRERSVDQSTATPHAHARTSDPDTSREAAAKLTPATLKTRHRDVLRSLRMGACTHPQLIGRVASDLRAEKQSDASVRSRCAELVAADLVEPTGKVKVGRSSFTTWALTPKGREVAV